MLPQKYVDLTVAERQRLLASGSANVDEPNGWMEYSLLPRRPAPGEAYYLPRVGTKVEVLNTQGRPLYKLLWKGGVFRRQGLR